MKTFFDETPEQLFAAEFDYFRIPPEKWELMLIRLKQMGLNTLAVTLPWGFHEHQQGTIDLNGSTNARRDIKTVLKLSGALGFYCLLNPGPYAARRGILGDGLPLWFYHTQEAAEAFLQPAAEGWLRAISKTLAMAYQWPHGPIIALQLNCTPPATPKQALSQQITRVKWPLWLRKQYHSIEDANAAWQTEYESVNQVEFPPNWQTGNTPLEQAAHTFISEIQQDTETQYKNILLDSGWQVPVYPAPQANLPALQYLPANQPKKLAEVDVFAANRLIILQDPIQVHPDPKDIGQHPGWANQAPIRSDGSLRQSFQQIRHTIWQHTHPQAVVDDHLLILQTDTGRLISCQTDASLNLKASTKPRPTVFRLRTSGLVAADEALKVSRAKIKGGYLSETETDPTDLLFTLNNPQLPMTGYLHTYLHSLLIAQAQTLRRCANLAETLSQTLAPPRPGSSAAAPQPEASASAESAYTLNTLEQARRGLREADAALKKAISSIDSLEDGFAAILKAAPEIATPLAGVSGIITPEIFEGQARETLIQIGADCANLVAPLNKAATEVQQVADQPNGLTIDQYQYGYEQAVTAARAGQEPLLNTLHHLRQMIGADQFPIVFWRVHDQLQHIAEALHWGVKRGA